MDYISTLPSELLGAVFEAGSFPAHRLRNETSPVPFPVLVSSVSRTWRHVAINTPHIWSSIFIDRNCSEQYLALCFERSKSCPLDVSISCVSFASVRQLTASHSNRWQRLRMKAMDQATLYDIINAYRNLQLPILRSLQLKVTEPEPWQRLSNEPWQLQSHLSLFDTSLPNLRSVKVTGLCSGCCSNFLKGLTSLEISSFAPSYSEMLTLVSECPELSTLVLPSFSCGGFVGVPDVELPQIEIPSLTSLAISFDWNHNALPCRCLLPYFFMPNLSYLEISGDDWQPHLSTHFPAPSGASPFKKLKTLRLHALDLSGVGVDFFHVFPSLTDLELVDVGNVTALDLSSLVSSSTISEFQGQFPWVALKRIKLDTHSTCNEPLLTWLSATIRRRQEIELPLSQVCMTNFMYQSTDATSLDEIRAQVQVEILPLTDDGLMDTGTETEEDEEDEFQEYASSPWFSEDETLDLDYDSQEDAWGDEDDFEADYNDLAF